MPRPKRTETEVQWRRERILAASAVVFQRVGFAAATMEEIAREAEYSPAALYNYFRSKEEIIVAAIEQVVDQMTRILVEPMPFSMPFEQRLRWRVQRMTETAFANRGLLMTLEGADGPPSLGVHAARAKQCADRTHSPWTSMMAEGQEGGHLRTDIAPEHLALALTGLMRGTMATLVAQPNPPELPFLADLTDRLVDLFLNGAKCR